MLEMRGVLFLVLGRGARGNGRLYGAFKIYDVGRSRGLNPTALNSSAATGRGSEGRRGGGREMDLL